MSITRIAFNQSFDKRNIPSGHNKISFQAQPDNFEPSNNPNKKKLKDLNIDAPWQLRDLTMEEAVDDIIKSTYDLKDEAIAREVLPTLIANDKDLQIGGHYDRFLGSITKENKDFAMKKVVPFLVKNYKKMALSDSYNNNTFMRAITHDNIEYAELLSEVSKDLGIAHSQYFRGILRFIDKKNKDFIFKQSIPKIIENRKKMLNPTGKETETLVKMVTPENINTIFSEDLPVVLKNAHRIKAKYSYDIVEALGASVRCGKDYVFKEVVPMLYVLEKEFGLEDNFDFQHVMGALKLDSKEKLLTIYNNGKIKKLTDIYKHL